MHTFEICFLVLLIILIYILAFVSAFYDGKNLWKPYAVCEACEYQKEAPFGKIIHTHLECCPRCGDNIKYFDVKTKRLNNEGVYFWKPWTWKNGFWEEKE